MTKRKHLILEVDLDRLSVAEAEPSKYGFQLGRHTVHACPGGDAEVAARVAEALAEVAPEGVHVVLPDKVFARIELALPRLRAAERRAVVERQARLKLDAAPDEPVLAQYRDGAILGVAHAALGGLRPLLADARLHTVCARSDAALHALPRQLPHRLALLDADRTDVRIVYLEEGRLARQRRMFHFDDRADRDELCERLRLEVGRTLQHFADVGLAPPDAIAFTPSLGLDLAQQGRVAGELEIFELPFFAAEEGDEAATFTLSTMGLLQFLSGRDGLVRIDRRPPPPGRAYWAAAAALLVAAALGLFLGLRPTGDERELARLDAELFELRGREIELDRSRAPEVDGDAVDPAWTETVLGARRPASLLLARVCAATPPEVRLTEVAYDETDRVVVGGIVPDADRLPALRAVGTLRAGLEELGLLGEIREEIVDGRPLRFRFVARWRP